MEFRCASENTDFIWSRARFVVWWRGFWCEEGLAPHVAHVLQRSWSRQNGAL